MKVSGIAYTCYLIRDLQRARRFYQRLGILMNEKAAGSDENLPAT